MTYGWWQDEDAYVELCDECGYDSRSVDDPATRLDAAYVELAALLEHPDAEARPAEETWSGREYVDHCVVVSRELLRMVSLATGRRPSSAVDDHASARSAASELVPALSSEDYATVVPEETPLPVTVGWAVLHLLHDLGHHAWDVRRGYARVSMAALPTVFAYER